MTSSNLPVVDRVSTKVKGKGMACCDETCLASSNGGRVHMHDGMEDYPRWIDILMGGSPT